MISILVGIIPGIFFAIIFYLLDNNKKDINLLLLIISFIFGCISSYICYRLEWHFGSYFKRVAESNLFEVYFYALFGVAIFEEGIKLFFSYIFCFLNKVTKKSNIFTYCIITSCGFLAFENTVFYSIKYGLNTAIRRVFTSSFGHVCYAIIMGVILFNVFKNNGVIKKILFLIISFIIPSMLHAFYNTFLYQGIKSLFIISYLFLGLLIILSTFIVYRFYIDRN